MKRDNFIKEVTPEVKLVLLIAKWVVHNNGLRDIRDLLIQEGIEWERLQGVLQYHEISSFAYPCLKRFSSFLDAKEMGLLEKSYYSCIVHLLHLSQEFKQIAHIFSDKDIEFVPLKGASFLVDNIYAQKGYLRPMCDIDILIKKQRLSLVEEMLGALGYEKCLYGRTEDYWKNKGYHLPFVRENGKGLSYSVEVHWGLDYKRKKPVLPHLWNRVERHQVEDGDMCFLSPEDAFFSIALHQRRFGKIISIKNILDTAMLFNKYKDTFDWDYTLRESRACNMRTTLYFMLAQMDLLLDIKIPCFVARALSIPRHKRRLIERFILHSAFSSNLALGNIKEHINKVYLKSHFLIYDNLWEPMRYILNIPQEQFAIFYKLDPYTRKTRLLYEFRYLYILRDIFMIAVKRLSKIFGRIGRDKKNG